MRASFRKQIGIAAALVLAGCGGKAPPQTLPRTVLVVQPGVAPGVAMEAFAGEIHAREESPLAFRIGGNLQQRKVDAGQKVRQGQVLATLDPGDAALQMAAAQADLTRLDGDLKRYKALLAQQLISRSAFDAQRAAQQAARAKFDLMRNQEAYTQLRAPQDGVIASRQAEAGQVVAAGQPIFVLASERGREVAISLPEARIRDFHTGQAAQIELWNSPGSVLRGSVREIAAAADPQTRTYAARVALAEDAEARVNLGQSARVWIGGTAEAPMRLPLSAVQRGAGQGAAVWVVQADGRVQLKPVTLGPYGQDSVPVVAGIRRSDWVVAAGGHLLHAGEAVRAVDRGNRPVAIKAG